MITKPQRRQPDQTHLKLLQMSGDVHPNPGPATKYPCPVCTRNVTSRGVSYKCTKCYGWVHAKCSGILNAAQYWRKSDWTCDACLTPRSQQSPPPTRSPAPPTKQISDDSTFNVLQLNANGIENKLTELEVVYNVPKSKTDRLQRIQNQCARILTKSPRREHITPVLMKLHWLKIQDRIIYKMLMLTYKSYYNMAPPYLCELINKKESHVNTRLGTDHHQLIMPPISKDCSDTFLERSFIYAAPCEWNKLSEHIRTSNFDCFRKSVKTMLFTQQYGC